MPLKNFRLVQPIGRRADLREGNQATDVVPAGYERLSTHLFASRTVKYVHPPAPRSRTHMALPVKAKLNTIPNTQKTSTASIAGLMKVLIVMESYRRLLQRSH